MKDMKQFSWETNGILFNKTIYENKYDRNELTTTSELLASA